MSDFSDFKRMLDTFDNNGRSSKHGRWSIGNGGYDCIFQIYYDNIPVIECIGYTAPYEVSIIGDYIYDYLGKSVTKYLTAIANKWNDVSVESALDDCEEYFEDSYDEY